MFQTDIVNSQHNLVSGLSFNLDNYNEVLDSIHSIRNERVPGIYTEYSYKPSEHFNLLAGARLDYHNLYGLMFTPRIHARFDIKGNTHFRLSAGKGYRSPMIIAENNHFLANSRKIIVDPDLKQEEAWNFGLNITQYIPLGVQPMSISAEVYRTSFLEQIIVDLDSDVDEVRFSNLNGKSYSNNYQVELSSQFLKGLETKLAFRYTDVKYTLNGQLVEKPLISRYKGLFVASYQTPLKKWQFDFTCQLNGPGRIPSTQSNPVGYRMEESFNAYTIINVQITKYFRIWELYAGVENLTDFRQMHAVIASDQPYGEYFDSSLIWGPLHGRKFYVGFRFRIERNDQ
jgi:outer membrane receptor for ferrienterochelin and colicin